MKLIIGNKYNLHMPYGKVSAYYIGHEGYQCDICGKKDIENAYEFLVPGNGVFYEMCLDGNYSDHIQIGKNCRKKITIEM